MDWLYPQCVVDCSDAGADNTEEMKQKILAFGVKTLDVPDPHLYSQAPGGQVFKLVGIDEDLTTATQYHQKG